MKSLPRIGRIAALGLAVPKSTPGFVRLAASLDEHETRAETASQLPSGLPLSGRRPGGVQDHRATRPDHSLGPLEHLAVHAPTQLRGIQASVDAFGASPDVGQIGQAFADLVRGDHGHVEPPGELASRRALACPHDPTQQYQSSGRARLEHAPGEIQVGCRALDGSSALRCIDPRVASGERRNLGTHHGPVGLEVVDHPVQIEVVSSLRVAAEEVLPQLGATAVREVHRRERHLGGNIDPAQALIELEAVDREGLGVVFSDIDVEGIGKDEDGATAAEATSAFLKALGPAVGKAVAKSGGAVGRGLTEALKSVGSGVKKALGGLKQAFRKPNR